MRGKFLFGLNESFNRFRKDIFYRDDQRKPEDPPFTAAFVVSQVISFEAARHTNKLLVNSTTEEQVHSPTSTTVHKLVKKPPGRSRPGTFLNRYCFLCGSMQQHYRDICPASGHTCRCCHKTDHFAGFCQQVAKENRASRPASHTPTPPGPRREYMRLVEQEEHPYTLPVEGIQY